MKVCWKCTLFAVLVFFGCSDREKKLPGTLIFREIHCSTAPQARLDASMSEDFEGKRIFLFGGRGEGGTFLSDLWVFQVDKNAWEKIEAQETPPARSGASLAWHPEKRTLFLFGGFSIDRYGKTRYLADLWLWNEQEGWHQEPFEIGPSGRAWAKATAWGDKVLFYGGYGKKELPESLGDLWALDTTRMEFEILNQEKTPPLKTALLAAEAPVLFDYRQVEGKHLLERKFLNDKGEIIFKTNHLDDIIALAHSRLGVLYFLAYYSVNEEVRAKAFSAASQGAVNEYTLKNLSPTLPGMACAPAQVAEHRFICFGGAWRDKISSTTWSFEHIE